MIELVDFNENMLTETKAPKAKKTRRSRKKAAPAAEEAPKTDAE